MTTRNLRLAFIHAALIAIMLLPQPGPASSATSPLKPGLPVRSEQEVAGQWNKQMNPSGNYANPYLTSPSVSSPYSPGSLKPRYIRDGVDAVNFYRFVSGLPYDLDATASLNA